MTYELYKEVINMQFIDFVQKRIANISASPSAVRGQPEGTKNKAIKYLESIKLHDFSNINDENKFKNLLDEHTALLREQLPSKSWGIARKVLNIFLFQATQDINLNKKYALDKIIAFLEVPLDNPNAKTLMKIAKNNDKELYKGLKWESISKLECKMSMKFQDYATRYAKQKYGKERCYLDVYWWASEENLDI